MASQPKSSPVKTKDHERNKADQPSRSALFPYLNRLLAHPRLGLFLAAAYGAVMLVIGLTSHTVGDYNVETDFFWNYVPEAKLILRGVVTIDGFRGPGYPILLALVSLVVRNYFIAGIIISTAAAALTLGLTYTLLRKLIGGDKAFFVALAVAVNGTFIVYTYTAGTDMAFTAVMTASAYFFMRGEERRYRDLIFAGLLAGAAYLMRYNGIVAVGVFAVGILLFNIYRLSWKDRMISAGVLVGAFIVTILPYGLYCLVQKGSFFFTENYLNIAREMYRDRYTHDQFWMTEVKRFTSTAQVIFGDPELFLKMVIRNVYEHFNGDMLKLTGQQWIVFVLPGVLLVWRERANRRLMTYLLLALGLFGILLLLLQQERYSLFLLPAYLTLSVLTLTWKGFLDWRFWNRVHIGGVLALGLLVWTLQSAIQFNRDNIDSGPKEIPAMAESFHRVYGDAERGKIVVSRKPHAAYYFDMEMFTFPMVNTFEELRTEVKKAGASYLFFGSMEAGLRPQFRQLLDPSQAPPWLVPVTLNYSPPAVMYRVDLSKAP
jgi:hypothetical protein